MRRVYSDDYVKNGKKAKTFTGWPLPAMVGRSFDLAEWMRTLSSKSNGLADQTSQRLGLKR
jgi:hypothetical protein